MFSRICLVCAPTPPATSSVAPGAKPSVPAMKTSWPDATVACEKAGSRPRPSTLMRSTSAREGGAARMDTTSATAASCRAESGDVTSKLLLVVAAFGCSLSQAEGSRQALPSSPSARSPFDAC